MPELPEVESVVRALDGVLVGAKLVHAKFYRKDLRWKIPVQAVEAVLKGHPVEAVERRSKYVLVRTGAGYGVFHLGMSGRILQQKSASPSLPHTHAVFEFERPLGERVWLHFSDPRRFGHIGAVHGHDLSRDKLFARLGPEPLSEIDLGQHLFNCSRKRKVAIKNMIMDAHVVVGVGNIYASEALFRAGIKPQKSSGKLRLDECEKLAAEIRATLAEAVSAGGTTFRDYRNADGTPGWFEVHLEVYGRKGETCRRCSGTIREVRLGGRSSCWCPGCQK